MLTGLRRLSVMRRADPAWAWMGWAFASALLLAAVTLGLFGTGEESIRLAIRMTARWSFLFFWLSYVGGSLAVLFGPAFARLARQRRQLGLAFASAHMVHIILVVWLGILIGRVPLSGRILYFFLLALFLTYLLMVFSFGAGPRILGGLWRPLLLAATSYILIAFGRDFVEGALDIGHHGQSYAVEYVPFAMLTLAAIVLRAAAFLRRHFPLRTAAA
jgi:hypothetical protein